MPSKYASAKNSISQCDRCGFRFKLKQLKRLVIKTKNVNILVCNNCWEPDQPQLQLGMYPVDDPQGVRDPRPDVSYQVSGLLADGESGGGSRVFQWGWNPVGGSEFFDAALTPNNLALVVQLGTVTVATT